MKTIAAAAAVLAGLALAAAWPATAASASTSITASSAPAAAVVVKGQFAAVSVASPANAWAVGCAIPTSDLCASDLAEHWNGKTWTRVAVPTPAGSFGADVGLTNVTDLSASDAWAIGTTEGGGNYTQLVHWNGRSWSQTSAPSLGLYGKQYGLAAISAVSAANIWAAGSIGGDALILHWNGKAWSRVPVSLNPSENVSGISSLKALSATNVWAVGSITSEATEAEVPLIVHWNGKSWTRERIPKLLYGGNSWLTAVAGSSAGNVWAVGLGAANTAVQFHWNGKSWSNQTYRGSLPIPGFGYQLRGVETTSSSSAWAVACCGRALHWTGKKWTPARIGTTAQDYQLGGLAAASPSSVWAAGSFFTASGSYVAVLLHWNGKTWTRSV
ncbi:MAG TPA: hypothetical protein VHZ33_31510 [Trebonia sp.]|jgi:hypothetical protein|nr:hypothetical protein [Trebonia sp.]